MLIFLAKSPAGWFLLFEFFFFLVWTIFYAILNFVAFLYGYSVEKINIPIVRKFSECSKRFAQPNTNGRICCSTAVNDLRLLINPLDACSWDRFPAVHIRSIDSFSKRLSQDCRIDSYCFLNIFCVSEWIFMLFSFVILFVDHQIEFFWKCGMMWGILNWNLFCIVFGIVFGMMEGITLNCREIFSF